MKPFSQLINGLLAVIPDQAQGQDQYKPLEHLRKQLIKKRDDVCFLELPEERAENARTIQTLLGTYDVDGTKPFHADVKKVWDEFWNITEDNREQPKKA